MELNTYLTFDGRCAEAFAFYAEVFGGTLVSSHTWAEAPEGSGIAAEDRDKVMHAQLRVGDRVLMGADAPKAWRTKPAGFSVSVNLTDVAEGRRIFDALADGGSVPMPYGPTFFAKGFGMLIDRFEIPWMVAATDPA